MLRLPATLTQQASRSEEEEEGGGEGGRVTRGEDPTPAEPQRGNKRQRDAEVRRGTSIQTSREAPHVSPSLADDDGFVATRR